MDPEPCGRDVVDSNATEPAVNPADLIWPNLRQYIRVTPREMLERKFGVAHCGKVRDSGRNRSPQDQQ